MKISTLLAMLIACLIYNFLLKIGASGLVILSCFGGIVGISILGLILLFIFL